VLKRVLCQVSSSNSRAKKISLYFNKLSWNALGGGWQANQNFLVARELQAINAIPLQTAYAAPCTGMKCPDRAAEPTIGALTLGDVEFTLDLVETAAAGSHLNFM
jgi:hypothetical protein